MRLSSWFSTTKTEVMSSVNSLNSTRKLTRECSCILMCMVIVQRCPVLSMEIMRIRFSIWFRIRLFASWFRAILLMEGSVRFSQSFLRKIWLCRKNMTSFRSCVLGECLRAGLIPLNSRSFILIRWRYCLIGKIFPRKRESRSKSYLSLSMQRDWQRRWW